MKRIIENAKANVNVVGLTFTDSLKTIFTDSGALLIIVFAALFYPVVYSIGYNNQVVTDIPVAVIDNDNTALSRKIINMVDATAAIKVHKSVTDMNMAEQMFWENSVMAVIRIPNGFEKDIMKGKHTNISLYADASNFLLYKESLKSTMEAVGTFSGGVEYKRFLTKVKMPELAVNNISPMNTRVQNMFNPSGGYGHFVMPGLMLLIIQQTLLVGIGLIGDAGRERKRNHTRIFGYNLAQYPFAAILGKSLAFFIVGMFNVLFGTILIYNWFSFPVKGEFINVILLSVPFLLSVVFLGMIISMIFKHREHSIIALVFLSPIVLFISGLSWPVEAIPGFLHWCFNIFPGNMAIPAFIRLRTMGVELVYIKYELVFLIVQMVVYYIVASLCYKMVLKCENVKM